jgi:uncharacterized protein YciI
MAIALGLAFLVSTVAGLWVPPQESKAQAPEVVTKGSVFAVTFRTGPAWDPAKKPQDQLHFRDHSENIRRLKTEERLIVGGRFSDVGLLLLRAESEKEARALVERDPTVQAGVFKAEIHPWSTFAYGCLESSH